MESKVSDFNIGDLVHLAMYGIADESSTGIIMDKGRDEDEFRTYLVLWLDSEEANSSWVGDWQIIPYHHKI